MNDSGETLWKLPRKYLLKEGALVSKMKEGLAL
jgi:hypothetical protein